MKKIIFKLRNIIIMKREIKLCLNALTVYIPGFNLSVKFRAKRGFSFYNNNDLIAVFTYDDAMQVLRLGTYFFNLLIYCLCIKNSIEKY